MPPSETSIAASGAPSSSGRPPWPRGCWPGAASPGRSAADGQAPRKVFLGRVIRGREKRPAAKLPQHQQVEGM